MSRIFAKPRLLALLILTSATWCTAAVRFEGIIRSADAPRFALVDDTNGETRWVGVKDVFAGFDVESYDERTKSLTLKKDSALTVIYLRTFAASNVAPQEKGTGWREAAESRAEAGDEVLRELLNDFDSVTAEAIGLAAFLDHARQTRPEGMSEAEWQAQIAESEREFAVRRATAKLFRSAIVEMLKTP